MNTINKKLTKDIFKQEEPKSVKYYNKKWVNIVEKMLRKAFQ